MLERQLAPGGGRLGRAGRVRIRLAAEAALRLLVAWAALRILPFDKAVRGLGSFTASGDTDGLDASLPVADVETVLAVAWAIRAAARRMPFEANCLPQAIAARAMLRRRGIAALLYLGAGHDGVGRMEAHAWVDAAGVGVTGYPVPPQLRKFGCFVTP